MNPLRYFRERDGLTQQQLADKVFPPTSQAQIDRLEKGQRKMTREWAERLGRALDVHWLQLMDAEIPVLSEDEKAIVDLYRGLNEHNRQALFHVVDAMAKSLQPDATPGKKVKGNGS